MEEERLDLISKSALHPHKKCKAPKKKHYYVGYDYINRKTCELESSKDYDGALAAAKIINSNTERLVQIF